MRIYIELTLALKWSQYLWYVDMFAVGELDICSICEQSIYAHFIRIRYVACGATRVDCALSYFTRVAVWQRIYSMRAHRGRGGTSCFFAKMAKARGAICIHSLECEHSDSFHLIFERRVSGAYRRAAQPRIFPSHASGTRRISVSARCIYPCRSLLYGGRSRFLFPHP